MRSAVLLLLLCACRERTERVALRIDPSEARAVLAELAAPGDAAFERVLDTVGYRRLRLRELGMGRRFDDAAMRAFVGSPELAARRAALAGAVAQWSSVDLDAIAARVLAYLPANAPLAAAIYPVIKPKPNSFVNLDVLGLQLHSDVSDGDPVPLRSGDCDVLEDEARETSEDAAVAIGHGYVLDD